MRRSIKVTTLRIPGYGLWSVVESDYWTVIVPFMYVGWIVHT